MQQCTRAGVAEENLRGAEADIKREKRFSGYLMQREIGQISSRRKHQKCKWTESRGLSKADNVEGAGEVDIVRTARFICFDF